MAICAGVGPSATERRRLLAPALRGPAPLRAKAGRRNEVRLQQAAVDRQPLLTRKLFIQISRRDLAAAAATNKHVSPHSLGERIVVGSRGGKCDQAHPRNKAFSPLSSIVGTWSVGLKPCHDVATTLATTMH